MRKNPPASVPDLFMVETNTTTWERTLKAVTASGEVDWLLSEPGVPLMGDMFGGVVFGVEPSPLHCVGPFNENASRPAPAGEGAGERFFGLPAGLKVSPNEWSDSLDPGLVSGRCAQRTCIRETVNGWWGLGWL